MMFRNLIVAFAVLTSASNAVDTTVSTLSSVEMMPLFEKWATKYGKIYHTLEEQANRAMIWWENHKRIEFHNTQHPAPTYTLGHNEFSDMTETEFQQYFKLGKYGSGVLPSLQTNLDMDNDEEVASQRRALLEENLFLPDYVNWRELGAVTRVKNQGSCGSCWAFSTTGALEGARFIKTGELIELSEQQLLDCDHEDLACSGGLMDNAFKFDQTSGGLCSEDDYPYIAKKNNVCMNNCTQVPGSIVKSFIDIPPGKEKALLAAIAMQPISIAIEASQFVFQFYKDGVITNDSCGSNGGIDHGVLAVGYGTDLETQEPYFLVKNSWGETWGDNGYVKIGRKTKNEFGICSILKMASFPLLV